MGSIKQKLLAILNSKSDIKKAIEYKGIAVGDIPLSGYAQKIMDIEDSGESFNEDDYDVEFIDYDGKVLIGMSKEEFLQLEDLPENPIVHENLIPDGWNWTFEEAHDYVSKYGVIVIGALYTTRNGASWFTINLDADDLLEMPIIFRQSVRQGVLVDWGDGTSERFNDGVGFSTRFHTYAEQGKYTIMLTPDEGCVLDIGASQEDIHGYPSAITKKWMIKREGIVVGRVGTYTRTFWHTYSTKYVVYPRGITLMQASAGNLGSTRSLEALILPPTITSVVGITSSVNCKYLSWPKADTTIGKDQFASCYHLKKIIIPEGVTSIGASAFYGCYNAKEIIIPDSVTSIGSAAFYDCHNIKKIIIPEGVTSIGAETFRGCYKVNEIIIPDGVTSIGQAAFSNCFKVNEIIIPEGVTSIGAYAFSGCYNAKKIIISDGVTSIGQSAFGECYNAKEIIIPDSVTTISRAAFNSCQNLQHATLSKNLTVVPQSLFSGCISLQQINLHEGITEIGESAFMSCHSFTEINLPESLVTIGSSAFNGCYKVESITIPKNVTSIGSAAFQCFKYNGGIFNKLVELHLKPTVPPTLTQAAYTSNYSVFSFRTGADIKVYVPKGCLEAYQTATNWTTIAQYMIEEEEEEV